MFRVRYVRGGAIGYSASRTTYIPFAINIYKQIDLGPRTSVFKAVNTENTSL